MADPDRVPEPFYNARTLNYPIDHLIHEFNRSPRLDRWEDERPWLLGYRIPTFQRPLVWTVEQKRLFIESAWLGLHLGIYVVNRFDRETPRGIHHLDRLLIDGQQRLEALRSYLTNEFTVFGYEWAQLNEREQRRLENIPFACAEIGVADEKKLIEVYNRLNFGGTPHTPDQRAVA